MASRFPFTSFPSGWFRVATSSKLRNGDVKALQYFGRQLVLFRTDDGKPHVLDAHCPHLGTHLGIGGRVKGNTVQCPLHGWQWNGEGRCEGVPLGGNLPTAKAHAWPIRETSGQIFVYYDPNGGTPSWEIPELPEYGHADWLPFRVVKNWKVRTHPQEWGENSVDMAHFSHLHHWLADNGRSVRLEASGPFLTHHTMQRYQTWLPERFRGEGPMDIELEGLGIMINRSVVLGKLRSTVVFFLTPIDEEHIEAYCTLSLQMTLGSLLTRVLWHVNRNNTSRAVEQDIPIWENKLYRPQPRLHESDGPIMRYRHWASQFYPERGDPAVAKKNERELEVET